MKAFLESVWIGVQLVFFMALVTAAVCAPLVIVCYTVFRILDRILK